MKLHVFHLCSSWSYWASLFHSSSPLSFSSSACKVYVDVHRCRWIWWAVWGRPTLLSHRLWWSASGLLYARPNQHTHTWTQCTLFHICMKECHVPSQSGTTHGYSNSWTPLDIWWNGRSIWLELQFLLSLWSCLCCLGDGGTQSCWPSPQLHSIQPESICIGPKLWLFRHTVCMPLPCPSATNILFRVDKWVNVDFVSSIKSGQKVHYILGLVGYPASRLTCGE